MFKGMLVLIEHGLKGLDHWTDELERRKVPAVILMHEDMVDENRGVVKNLSDRGFDIGGIYGDEPFWGIPYEYQYKTVRQIKDKIESCIDGPMRSFGSKYFAYDETTVKVADKLGIEYILARGTAGARAIVYKPDEYNTTIISVSNVPSKKTGSGSLCDVSLWARGEGPEDFRKTLFGLREPAIVLVTHTHLGGLKLHWWNVYQDFLNANLVKWESLDQFTVNPVSVPNAQIPLNREVRYTVPNPKLPIEEEPCCCIPGTDGT